MLNIEHLFLKITLLRLGPCGHEHWWPRLSWSAFSCFVSDFKHHNFSAFSLSFSYKGSSVSWVTRLVGSTQDTEETLRKNLPTKQCWEKPTKAGPLPGPGKTRSHFQSLVWKTREVHESPERNQNKISTLNQGSGVTSRRGTKQSTAAQQKLHLRNKYLPLFPLIVRSGQTQPEPRGGGACGTARPLKPAPHIKMHGRAGHGEKAEAIKHSLVTGASLEIFSDVCSLPTELFSLKRQLSHS
jgi:hypothetical protein